MIEGVTRAMGLLKLASELGFKLSNVIRLGTDSSAAKSFVSRRGLGRMRHLDTRDLWLQKEAREGKVLINKILGTENPADLMTKILGLGVIEERLRGMNLYMRKSTEVSRVHWEPVTYICCVTCNPEEFIEDSTMPGYGRKPIVVDDDDETRGDSEEAAAAAEFEEYGMGEDNSPCTPPDRPPPEGNPFAIEGNPFAMKFATAEDVPPRTNKDRNKMKPALVATAKVRAKSMRTGRHSYGDEGRRGEKRKVRFPDEEVPAQQARGSGSAVEEEGPNSRKNEDAWMKDTGGDGDPVARMKHLFGVIEGKLSTVNWEHADGARDSNLRCIYTMTAIVKGRVKVRKRCDCQSRGERERWGERGSMRRRRGRRGRRKSKNP